MDDQTLTLSDNSAGAIAGCCQHLMVECYSCDYELIDDLAVLRRPLAEVRGAANARELSRIIDKFTSQGVTDIIAISESHISVHTWSECQFTAVDVFTRGALHVDRVLEIVKQRFQTHRLTYVVVQCGPGATASNLEHPRKLARVALRYPTC